MNTIMNATRNPIVAKFDGANYKFLPGEKKEIFNSFAAKHIVMRWGKYGLVDITYTEKVAKKYPSPMMYEHSQRLEGITKYLQTLMEKNQNFLQYDEECGTKKTVERLRIAKIQKQVEADIKLIEKDLKATEKIDMKDLISKQRADLLAQAESLRKQAEQLGGKDSIKSPGSPANRT